jgi:hypothetical protein
MKDLSKKLEPRLYPRLNIHHRKGSGRRELDVCARPSDDGNSGHILFFGVAKTVERSSENAFRPQKSKQDFDKAKSNKQQNVNLRPLEKRSHWQPLSRLKEYGENVKVVTGKSEGKANYFRAFSNCIKVSPKLASKQDEYSRRTKELLPYRFQKTARLYGVSPLVLIVKATPKKKQKNNSKPSESSKRLNGPEIAPNMAEFDEFPDEFNFESKESLEGLDKQSTNYLDANSFELSHVFDLDLQLRK